jgi:hypothetical protein
MIFTICAVNVGLNPDQVAPIAAGDSLSSRNRPVTYGQGYGTIIPVAGTLSTAIIAISDAPVDENFVLTICVNNVLQALSVVIPIGQTTGSNLVDSVAIAAGDEVGWATDSFLTSSPGGIEASITFLQT